VTEAEVNGWIAHAIKAITPAVVRASWERSAVAEYNAFHLPDAPWEALLSYFDEKDDKLTVLKAARAEYETSSSSSRSSSGGGRQQPCLTLQLHL
jgi:hypothetical protein